MNDAYRALMERVKDVGRLGAIEQLLDWDQETYMPPNGVSPRAEQMALIAGLAHEQLTADETGTLLESASCDEGDYVAQTNIRETRRSFDRAVKIPTQLVKDIAHATAVAKDAWAKARGEDNFAGFVPHLKKLVDLKGEVAGHVGFETEAYDALMDEFEPGARANEIAPVFAALRKATVELLGRIDGAADKPDGSILTRHYAREKQEALCRYMADAVRFDFDSGRMDVSVHPFCVSVGSGRDVRLTTRYLEDFLPSAMFGTLHEAGHGLYEQGLLADHRFTPMGEAISLGIHESQSRLWENMVGRSRPFWAHHYAHLQGVFPDALGEVNCESFYRAINIARPSFIRVEADELTYNLHIIVRFEIERAMFSGQLSVEDVPDAWRAKFEELLGIVPANNAEGCLQDIHWSIGIFGYFPTYAMGNLYAAQFYEQAERDLPGLAQGISEGNVDRLLSWLRENIHQHGRRYRASELVEVVTGKPLSIEPFVGYITAKLKDVYRID